MISIKQLHKQFGKNKVLKGIDLELHHPGITAILGPNGSGKTTLIKCLLGMVRPNSGTLTFQGQSIKKQYTYRNEIAHLPQIARFPENLTPAELIHMIKDLRRGQTNENYFIDLFGLQPELNKKMHTLSGGNRQKINLLLALMYDTPLIILDEPSTGLDPLALIRLKDHLLKERQRGKQILITTHIMSLVEELADRIIFLLEGKIFFNGTTAELLNRQHEDTLEKAIARILNPHFELIKSN